MRRSERIAALEEELGWYREESITQSKMLKQYREETNRMRIQVEDAHMEIAEMENILAKQQRKSKILKAALLKSQAICAQLARTQRLSGLGSNNDLLSVENYQLRSEHGFS